VQEIEAAMASGSRRGTGPASQKFSLNGIDAPVGVLQTVLGERVIPRYYGPNQAILEYPDLGGITRQITLEGKVGNKVLSHDPIGDKTETHFSALQPLQPGDPVVPGVNQFTIAGKPYTVVSASGAHSPVVLQDANGVQTTLWARKQLWRDPVALALPEGVKMTPTPGSEAVRSFGYDPKTGTHYVVSQNGGNVIRIPGVTPKDAAAFAAAESKGRALNAMARKYVYKSTDRADIAAEAPPPVGQADPGEEPIEPNFQGSSPPP
jgi:hypothetical protein